jgi:peptidoglycan DL-endopeptidase RipA
VSVRGTGVSVRSLVRALVGVVLAGLVLSMLAPPASARPRNPSDGEIAAAKQDRARKAGEVGRLTALVARADGDMRRAQERAELAVERYNKAVVDLRTATVRSQRAKAKVAASARAVGNARHRFGSFVRESYMQGSTVGSATALLDATSPTDLLDRADLLVYVSHGRLDAVGQLNRARIRLANAESAARLALRQQQLATVRAERAKVEAAQQVADAKSRLAALQQQRAGLYRQLQAARVRLNGLLAERVRYQKWKRAQEIAAARERERQRRLRAEAARRAAAAAAAERAARSQPRPSQDSPSVSPSPSSWGGGWRGGGWSAAKGQRVADLALRWLGTPYIWGGGDASGPTWGLAGPTVGFDCSGLALWAWAQVGIYLPHYSGYQYTSGQHVSVGNLMPGDLVFWAYNTSDPGSIHHVAIYLGGGQVVQAPQSGDVVRISSMWFSGYIGATRPGT